jgi:uncharacterized protein YegP (UPF0339 family)
MTRSAQVTKAVNAKTRAQAVTPKRNARVAANASKQTPMRFLVFEDNSGGYYWTIVAKGGETLVQSASFTSFEDAKQAARIVHGGAASAAFEDDAAGS